MKVWVGFHPNLGIVIFDPTLQDGIPSHCVRLWDVAAQRFRVFQKAILKKRLTSLRAFLLRSQLTPLVITYDVVQQIATAYRAARPQLPKESPKDPVPRLVAGEATWEELLEEWADEAKEWARSEKEAFRPEPDSDEKLIWEEIASDQVAWARSEEEGWYYTD